MATVALAVGGAAAGASIVGAGATTVTIATGVAIGTAVGASAGAFIDQAYVYPTVFNENPPAVEGPKIQEQPFVSTNEGGFIPLVYGRNIPVGGQAIWVSPEFEELPPDIQDIDISKNVSQEIITRRYSVNLAFCVGRAPMFQVNRAWAEGDVFYSLGGVFAEEGSMTITPMVTQLWPDPIIPGAFGEINWARITAELPIDLTTFAGAFSVVVSGFSNAINNGTFFVRDTGVLPEDSNKTYIDITHGNAILETADVSLGQSPENILPWDIRIIGASPIPGLDTGVVFYNGGPTQAVPQLLSAWDGNILNQNDTPGYRGVGVIALERLKVESFNNRIPRLYFDCQGSPDDTDADVIKDLLNTADIDDTNIDVSELDTLVSGYLIDSPTTPARAIRPLMRAYNTRAQETHNLTTNDWQLRFFKQGNEKVVTVNEDELASHIGGQESPPKMIIRDIPDHQLPTEVVVSYFDINNALQKSSVGHKLINSPFERTIQLDFPMSLTAAEARNIAQRELSTAWQNRKVANFVLPPKYVTLKEQDIVVTEADGIKLRVLVTKVRRGDNFMLDVEGLIQSAESLEFDQIVDDPNVPSQDDPTQPLYILGSIVDVAPLLPQHVGKPGLYMGASRAGLNGTWQGVQVYMSTTTDDDDQFQNLGSIPTESPLGYAAGNALADGPYGYWDRKNKVTILLNNGQLVNRTADEVLSGENIAMIGPEIIGYQNATLINPQTYELSVLLRGIRGTDKRTGDHLPDEVFTPLTALSLRPFDIGEESINDTLHFRFLSTGQDVQYADTQSVVFRGKWGKPFDPVRAKATRNFNNQNIRLTWDRRSLFKHKMFMGQFPSSFWPERYLVEIRDDSNVLVRTVIVDGSRTYIYDLDSQGEDGTSGDAVVKFDIYQMSNSVYGNSLPTHVETTA